MLIGQTYFIQDFTFLRRSCSEKHSFLHVPNIFSYVHLTAIFLACPIVKLTFSALDVGQSRWNCHAIIALKIPYHSRPQSLRSFWPAAGIESSGSNHFERTKEITEFWLSGSLRICIYGACLKWLLPELSFSDRWSKGTRLWEREWFHTGSTGSDKDFIPLASVQSFRAKNRSTEHISQFRHLFVVSCYKPKIFRWGKPSQITLVLRERKRHFYDYQTLFPSLVTRHL